MADEAQAPQTGKKLPDVDKMSFKQAMAELDDIVARLESNTMELEDSLAAYERGVALLRSLRGRLDKAQQKVDVLMGELEDNPAGDDADTGLHKA